MLMVQRPSEGEGLQQYALRLSKDGTVEPIGSTPCPAVPCLLIRASQPGMYGKDGDGRGRIVAFEREEPAFPGVLLESPLQIPKPDEKEGVQYFRPAQLKHRMSGKLYYVVLLDVASSIEQPALQDYEFFLKNLTVE